MTNASTAGPSIMSISMAQRAILDSVQQLAPEVVTLTAGLGRILAEEIRAPWDLPFTDNSAMDGYAFCWSAALPESLCVCGYLPAGGEMNEMVPAGQAVKIMTGAPLPPGCDTVIPVEDVLQEGGEVRFRKTVKRGDNVRNGGEDIQRGELALKAGVIIGPPEVAMLAALGRRTVRVFRRARVAVLSTGDELLDAGSMLVPGKVINSNGYCLAAQIMAAGAEPIVIGTARDDMDDTRRKMAEGLQADCLVTSGGVSMGDRDYVKEVIAGMGGDIRFWRVAIKPGKPMAFALVDGKPIFSLPGNPVSVFVSFEQFVRPGLLRMMGHRRLFRPILKAVTDEPLCNKGKRPHLVRGVVRLDAGRYQVTSTGSQSSSRISSLLNCIVLSPESNYPPGTEVDVQIFDRDFEMGEIFSFERSD